MISQSVIYFLNTNGVFLLLGVVLAYFWIIEKSKTDVIKVVISVVTSGFLVIILKELFFEPRPFLVKDTLPGAGLTNFSSFPSLHSALAFTTATRVYIKKKKFGLILFMAAILIGVGRILADLHYPQDILFGIIIGVIVAMLIEDLMLPIKIVRRKGRLGY